MGMAGRSIGYDEVVPRDLHFKMNTNTVARHWFNGDPWITQWMNSILTAVPDGERWVMNSARVQLDKLTNPAVRKAAVDFCRQERIHAREHDEMNAISVAQGVPLDKLEAVFKKVRLVLQERLSEQMQSSLAAAFEHFTAVMSSVMLENPDLLDETHPELAAMLYWHFVEETEHKGVSFDVFVHAGGSYATRVGGMAFATLFGAPLMIGNHAYLLYKDKQLTNWRSALRMANLLLNKPGILTRTLAHYLPYYQPDFHPWDDDNRAIIRVWKRAYEKNGDAHEAYRALREHQRKQAQQPATRSKNSAKAKRVMPAGASAH